ncbi:hypothetical protein LTR53_018001, partial [Teratosphaeriaceae sp. CCFEE 6253]
MATGLYTNYFGAAIFWAYNLAALALTSIVIHTLVNIQPPQHETHGTSRRYSRVFSGLAVLSFTTLSFSMLSVLIQSYTQWSRRVLGADGEDQSGIASRIWLWSITSTLFRDFGEAIVANQARYLWVLSALFAT